MPPIPSAQAGSKVLTLFMRQYCGLCEAANETLIATPFELRRIDIDEPAHKQWLRKYTYDVPVVHLGELPGEIVGKHRFEAGDVERWLKGPPIIKGP
ncbi:hypothetical protein HKX48_002342 [Thoreauomyces humboldtii]|nr:hypothetical protein HKX48_002342 [Thoreauomyces humboldtii]